MPTTHIITLPCTARELEAALHAYCDAHGAWDAKVYYGIYEPLSADALELYEPTVWPDYEKKGEAK